MAKNIFVVGTFADKTTRYTAEALKRLGVRFSFIDLGSLTSNGFIEYDPSAHAGNFRVFDKDHPFDKDSRFYVRLLDISRAAPTEGLKSASQSVYDLVANVLSATGGRVLNPPNKTFYNVSKLFHLGAIKLRSTLIPESISSTNPQKVMEFIEKHEGAVVVKGASSSKTKAAMVDQDDLKRIQLVKNAPPLFQELIKGVELRIHYVAGSCFGEIIATNEIDYRFANKKNNVVTMNYKVSAMLQDEVKSIAAQLGLEFLGIDFKFSEKTGRWYFLEANPMPCYYGYDIRSGKQISQSICDFLTA